MQVFFAVCVVVSTVSISAETSDCKHTFRNFLSCADERMKMGRIEAQLEDELNSDFSRLVKRCFSRGSLASAQKMCPLSNVQANSPSLHGVESVTSAMKSFLTQHFFNRQPSIKQCIRRRLYNSFPNYIRNCYRAELGDPKAQPENLPDIDGDALNISDAVQATYHARMVAYSSIANCARENLAQARVTTSCMVSPARRLYNQHCVKLMAGCLQEALMSTGLPCIAVFDKTKKGMCNCALLHRKKIMRNMLEVDKLMRSALPTDVCEAKITEMLNVYLVTVEMAFKSCLEPTDLVLPIRSALIEACASDSSELKRTDAVQAAFVALSFFQAAIDRFDRFCQADCPHEALLDFMKNTKGK
uniref:Uncharacterized protein n=1 Tax=Trichuris muris TaxID=70415 RepID=A0A5S6QUW2_TRIMR